MLENHCISLWFSGADVGALDSKKYTPLMVAAAWNNDALFREMMDKDMAAVEKSSFNAACVCDKPSLNFLRVSQSCPEYSFFFYLDQWCHSYAFSDTH